MATAMLSGAGRARDDMMDIDIDMDIDDMGPAAGDEMIEEGEDTSYQAQHQDPSGIIPDIYNEDPALEPQWQKIHVKGVDDMHTNDILAFAKDYFPHADPHVQWIDDSSANLVFQDKDTARQALLAFLQTPTTSEAIANHPFETRQAKQLASRPTSIMTVRVAQAADRKRKNAREASRWYLLHPEDDPGEKTRNKAGRADNGDYQRRRFDERELRRRRDKDHNTEIEDFSANMYDDVPSTETDADKDNRGRDLFSRVSKPRRRSASPGGYSHSESDSDGRPRRRRNGYRDRSNPPPYSRRNPNPHPRNNVGKELFSSSANAQGTLRSDLIDRPMSQPGMPRQNMNGSSGAQDSRAHNSVVAKRLKADLLASISNPSGQHPPSPRNGHRRSHAMDAKNDEDLAERFGRKSISLDSTKSINAKTANSGIELFPSSGGNTSSNGLNIRGATLDNGNLNIRGSAGVGLSIKGRAGADQVKELFPDQYNRNTSNRGKELFDQPIRERGRRQRAGDLFD